MFKALDIKLKDSVFEPGTSSRKIYFKKTGGSTLYKVWLYLEGDDLPYVMKTTYRLHPTFPNANQSVSRSVSNPDCRLAIWTWGLFRVKAIVEEKSGPLHEVEHDMQYDGQFNEQGVEFIDVGAMS